LSGVGGLAGSLAQCRIPNSVFQEKLVISAKISSKEKTMVDLSKLSLMELQKLFQELSAKEKLSKEEENLLARVRAELQRVADTH